MSMPLPWKKHSEAVAAQGTLDERVPSVKVVGLKIGLILVGLVIQGVAVLWIGL